MNDSINCILKRNLVDILEIYKAMLTQICLKIFYF